VVPLGASFDKSFTLPFDNRNGFLTGVALVNNGIDNGTVTLTARDNAGTILVTDSFSLPFLQKVVYLIASKYSALAGKSGTLQYTVSGGLSGLTGLGLRFNPTGSFTSQHALTLAP